MRFEPELAALRGNDVAQRQSQQAFAAVRERWHGAPQGAAIMKDLARYGAGAGLAGCAHLARLIGDLDHARAVIEPLVADLLGAMTAEPLGEVPLRSRSEPAFAHCQIAASGRAVLALTAHEDMPGRRAEESAGFADGDLRELVVAGSADLLECEVARECVDRAAIDCQPRRVVAGESLVLDGPRRARAVVRVHGCCVFLRLSRRAQRPADTRRFRLDDGTLLHRASGDAAESRHELMMALLRQMERRDAVPALLRLAREGSEHFRWQAVREILALDAAAGFAELSRLARDPQDPLTAPAAALRAQLVELHPVLEEREAQPCPA